MPDDITQILHKLKRGLVDIFPQVSGKLHLAPYAGSGGSYRSGSFNILRGGKPFPGFTLLRLAGPDWHNLLSNWLIKDRN